ncbi:hypothetical protein JL722_1932 [Aureococcus anophagefferens]|nr:hypothetical protein JL722_1932 [Aureococcus anophagefferens]
MYVSSETTGQCASDAYFDTVTLACRDCSDMAADDATAAVLVGADFDAFGNARSCACPAGYAFVDGSAACSTDGACASVGHDGAYLESKACAACAAGRFAAWGDSWVAGAFYPGNPYACASCPDARMAWTGSACACAAGYDAVGEATVGARSCVLSSQRDELEDRADVDDAGLVVYDAIQTQKGGDAEGYDAFDSAVFHHMFVNSSTRCLYHDGTASADAACQTLANLCVMTGYRLDAEACEFPFEFGPGEFYEELRDERGDKHDEGAQESLPWLLYDADGETVRKDAGVQTPFAFTASARNRYHKLELRALAYALNGTFLGSEPFDADFFYCETQTPRTKSTSRCYLPGLVGRELVFYDLYVVDRDGDCEGKAQDGDTRCLYPVPVLMKTLRDEDGNKPNRNGKSNNFDENVFSRRFSLFDATTAVPFDDDLNNPGELAGPTYVRYLVEAIVHVEVGEDRKMREDKVEFYCYYYMDSSEFWRICDALFFVLLSLSGMCWIYYYSNWQAENYGGDVTSGFPQDEFVYFIKWVMLYCRLFVHIFFPFMFAMSSYILVFFKLQDTVYLLLPRENREDGKGYEYYPVRVMLVSLWAFQTANVLKVIYDQCSVDIFFVDWERPRSETLRHKVPVSIWRTLFVANEWNELQTVRRTNVTFILFLLGWLLVGEQLENAATAVPDLEDLADGHANMALRFASTTWWWFHGYYLHGDAPWAHADDTMDSISRHLLNEANAESIGRGLDGALPDIQTFQLWLTPAFRQAWTAVNSGAASAAAAGGGGGGAGAGRGFEPPSLVQSFFGGRGSSNALGAARATTVAAHKGRTGTMEQVGAFLRTFLTHGYADEHNLDWELRVPNVFERVSFYPPPQSVRLAGAKGKVIFQPDKPWFGGDNGWTSVTFLGHDYEFLIHEMLTFAVTDMWFRQTWLSILVVFLSHHGLRILRQVAGESNLSDRTLVDSRFLI